MSCRRILSRGRGIERAQNHRPFFHFSRAREAVANRRARHAFQCPVSLGGAGGREIETGGEVGRHHILTHCYWREAGPEFKNVNIMAVAHGTEKPRLLEHKAAIDRHLVGVWHSRFLHQCFLGRPQRDQAIRDFSESLSRMARGKRVKALVEKLQAELDLTSADVDLAVAQLLSDQVDDELKADFLTALHRKARRRKKSSPSFSH